MQHWRKRHLSDVFITEDSEEYPFHKLVKFTPEHTNNFQTYACQSGVFGKYLGRRFFFKKNNNKNLLLEYKVERNFDLFFIKK
jgi:hypothetical protein